MPTYQYACTECGHSFDIVQSFSDDSLTVCPECDGRLRKVFNAVGVVFKGSGFYRTDSRGKPATESSTGSTTSSDTSSTSGKGAPETSTSPAKSEPASASKPAKKSESAKV